LARKSQNLQGGAKPDWTHVWAGAYGESIHGLLIIDAVPIMPNCFTVMGLGGNGTIYSMIAAGSHVRSAEGPPFQGCADIRVRSENLAFLRLAEDAGRKVQGRYRVVAKLQRHRPCAPT